MILDIDDQGHIYNKSLFCRKTDTFWQIQSAEKNVQIFCKFMFFYTAFLDYYYLNNHSDFFNSIAVYKKNCKQSSIIKEVNPLIGFMLRNWRSISSSWLDRLRISDRKFVNHTTEMILWSMILSCRGFLKSLIRSFGSNIIEAGTNKY